MSHDLIIVGGGLVGAGLAVALKDAPISIALVDARLPSSSDPRLFALTCSSIQFLKNLEIWPALWPVERSDFFRFPSSSNSQSLSLLRSYILYV